MATTKRQILKVIIISLLAVLITVFLFLMIFKVQIFTGPFFYLRFEHVGSLTVGAVVRTAGVRIGTVSDIKLDQTDFRTVIVTVTLYPGQKVRRGSSFLVMSGSLIGDQYIEVLPVPNGDFILDGESFKGEPIKNLDSFLLSSNTLIQDFTSAMSTLADILADNKDDIRTVIANLRESSDTLRKYMSDGEGTNSSMLARFTSLLENLDKSSSALTRLLEDLASKDSVVTLLNQKETSSDMKVTLTNLRKISDGLVNITADLETIMAGVVGPAAAPNEKK
jgi:ABC-type transporter Mla subunit MlaD